MTSLRLVCYVTKWQTKNKKMLRNGIKGPKLDQYMLTQAKQKVNWWKRKAIMWRAKAKKIWSTKTNSIKYSCKEVAWCWTSSHNMLNGYQLCPSCYRGGNGRSRSKEACWNHYIKYSQVLIHLPMTIKHKTCNGKGSCKPYPIF
jgi:hypothetical protein